MEQILEFSSNHLLMVVALVTSFFVLVFTELRRKTTGLINVEAGEAVKLINDNAVVLDLRNADAYSRGHIVGAHNVPADELSAKLDSLKRFQGRPIVAVCDAGVASTRAVNELRTAGFDQTVSLKGGMTGWGQAGMPVVTGKKTRAKGKKSKK